LLSSKSMMMRRNNSPDPFDNFQDLNGPLSVYIHIPFCLRKCPYCAFYSISPSGKDIEKYLHSLEREMEWWRAKWGRPFPEVKTLYLGGGTPSFLTLEHWQIIKDMINKHFTFSDEAEISVEANPDSLTSRHLVFWKGMGVSRVSLGIQSLLDEELQTLQRPYSRKEALRALELVKGSGLHLSADLMFAFPGHNLRSWHYTLHELVHNFIPRHISAYQLVLEPSTPWEGMSPSSLPDGYPLYRFTQWYLGRKGYDQYEISSFAREGNYCTHNLAYWNQDDVLGLGPSAWGYLNGTRYQNCRELGSYITAMTAEESPVIYTEHFTGSGKAREAAVLALRTKWGFSPDLFSRLYGKELLEEILNDLREVPPELLHITPEGVSLTGKGMRVGNAIWEKII